MLMLRNIRMQESFQQLVWRKPKIYIRKSPPLRTRFSQILNGVVDIVVRKKKKTDRGVLRDPSDRAKPPDFRAIL
jgi:hypothetical protein